MKASEEIFCFVADGSYSQKIAREIHGYHFVSHMNFPPITGSICSIIHGRHEMRNPLSAIIQSADGIAASLAEFNGSGKDPLRFQEIADSNHESAQIIALCAQHQGRIINDVLTLSKLDSGMLVVDPMPVQPIHMMRQTLRMFEGELAAHAMAFRFVEDESLQRQKVDWVLMDPSRVNQVPRCSLLIESLHMLIILRFLLTF